MRIKALVFWHWIFCADINKIRIKAWVFCQLIFCSEINKIRIKAGIFSSALICQFESQFQRKYLRLILCSRKI